MRKFYIDVDGTRIPLNGESGILLHDVAGLGVTFSSNFADDLNGFFIRTNVRQKQGAVTGTLTIFGNAYADYETFVNAVLTARRLTLIYNPTGTEFRANVAINLITKTESVVGVRISTPISFSLMSLWYTEQELTGTGSVSVTHAGQIASAVKVTTTGTALTNPVISMSDGNGVFAKAKITKEITAAQTLEYQNYYDDSHIVLKTTGEADEDLIPATNITNAVFGKTKANYTVTVMDENDSTPAISVTVRRYWRTV